MLQLCGVKSSRSMREGQRGASTSPGNVGRRFGLEMVCFPGCYRLHEVASWSRTATLRGPGNLYCIDPCSRPVHCWLIGDRQRGSRPRTELWISVKTEMGQAVKAVKAVSLPRRSTAFGPSKSNVWPCSRPWSYVRPRAIVLVSCKQCAAATSSFVCPAMSCLAGAIA